MKWFPNGIYRVVEGCDDQRIGDINLDSHGTAELAAWAASAGIAQGRLRWVDDCWLKVSVSTPDVAAYLDAFAEPALAARLKAALEPDEVYTIAVEDPF